MRFLSAVASQIHRVTHLLRSLCFSQFLWSAGFATLSVQQVQEVQDCVCNTL